MISRNRTSLICNNLCIYSHLGAFMVIVEKKNSFQNDLKWLLTIFYQFLVLLNYSEQDQDSLPAPAPDCLCQAGLPSWSVTPLINRTSPNTLLLCKVLFPSSLHPPYKPIQAMLHWLPVVLTNMDKSTTFAQLLCLLSFKFFFGFYNINMHSQY